MNAIERVNAMAELARNFADMYNERDGAIDLVSVSSLGLDGIPAVHVWGIYNLAKLLDKEPYTLGDDVCVDYKGVRFFEYRPTEQADD
jgi:hypothetical protein